MSAQNTKLCSCGKAKPTRVVTCHSCWHDLPSDLRIGWTAAVGVIGKRAAKRNIIEFLKTLKPTTMSLQ